MQRARSSRSPFALLYSLLDFFFSRLAHGEPDHFEQHARKPLTGMSAKARALHSVVDRRALCVAATQADAKLGETRNVCGLKTF